MFSRKLPGPHTFKAKGLFGPSRQPQHTRRGRTLARPAPARPLSSRAAPRSPSHRSFRATGEGFSFSRLHAQLRKPQRPLALPSEPAPPFRTPPSPPPACRTTARRGGRRPGRRRDEARAGCGRRDGRRGGAKRLGAALSWQRGGEEGRKRAGGRGGGGGGCGAAAAATAAATACSRLGVPEAAAGSHGSSCGALPYCVWPGPALASGSRRLSDEIYE